MSYPGPKDLQDLRYPAMSIGVGATAQPADGQEIRSWRLPHVLPTDRPLAVVCFRPLTHVLEFAQLYALLEALRERTPASTVALWLVSQFRDWRPLRALPASTVHALPAAADRPAWAALVSHWESSGSVCLGLDGRPPSLPRTLKWLDGGRFDFAGPPATSRAGVEASDAFFAASQHERWWTVNADTGWPPAGHPRILVHQSRFRVGNTLWITPVLRELRRLWPQAHVTVAGSRVTARVLQPTALADAFLVFDPDAGAEARGWVFQYLRSQRYHAALMALTRRPKSRWLAEMLAQLQVPLRINIEYVDGMDDCSPSALFTHEGWFYWGAIASPRFLLQCLAPIAKTVGGASRALLFPIHDETRMITNDWLSAREITQERGFVVITPAGRSSSRWPAQNYVHLGEELYARHGWRPVIDTGPGEAALGRAITGALAAAGVPAVHSCASLAGLTALLERASLLVSSDSAPIHCAATVATPTVYFSHHEKLTHSHPASADHWALFDRIGNRISAITTVQVLDTVTEIQKRLRPRSIQAPPDTI
ncbi:MAG: hypothetical protein GKR94_00405 [Gammaproteobacteria bacterium]|nr:hypothetical protein [Gammaproteobacteria bacterium]